ncbi:hypothetical protein H4687_000415 [Streptomyces stelliscabiei]|uniref:Uncharacterized protein n=1 Tax=Streptomyces stelliscabiei TaxID=146820 RepID=A0A8I0P0Y3_9ACTN|nr:hypothetical protein [Streptomyces stelliscabiei]
MVHLQNPHLRKKPGFFQAQEEADRKMKAPALKGLLTGVS